MYEIETQEVNRVAQNRNVQTRWSSHFWKRAEERNFNRRDVINVLKRGTVTEKRAHPRIKDGQDRWAVEGEVQDGRGLKVIVEVYVENNILNIISVMPAKG